MEQMLTMVSNRDIGDFCLAGRRGNPALIGNLTAGKSIEIRLGKSDISFFINGIDFLAIDKESGNLTLKVLVLFIDEFARSSEEKPVFGL